MTFITMLASCQDNKQTEKQDATDTPATPSVTQSTDSQAATKSLSKHPGAAIHQETCEGCHIIKHDAAFYQRKDRKMDSYERLQSQVRLCNSNLELELFDEDMTLIGEYLNETYYHFPVH